MIEELAQDALEKSLIQSDEAEIYVEMERGLDVDIQKDKVGFAKEIYSLGVGIRVIISNKMGFAYTTNPDLLQDTVNRAVASANANQKDPNFNFASEHSYPKIRDIYDSSAENMDIDAAVGFAKDMVAAALEKGCQPTSGGYALGMHQSLLINSEGCYCDDKATKFTGFISVNAPDGENVSTAHESDMSCQMNLDPEKISHKASQLALDSMNGVAAETKDFKVILDHHAVAGLLFIFSQAINGDNVQRGRSIYADQIGEQVTSPNLTVYDDGTLTGALGSSRGDGEGMPSQKTIIIQDGVLQNFIYDLYTAKKGEEKSTGNGMRASFSDIPSPSPSNMDFQFREAHDMSEVKNGILVTDVLGAHTANPISGDFSVEAMNAFNIESGDVGRPIKKAMLSGNIFQILRDSGALNDVKRQIGPFIVPKILCPQLRIVG